MPIATAPAGYEVKDLGLSRVETKAKGKLITELTGLVAAFGNVDSYNDVIEPGAFTRTLAERVPARKVKLLADHLWDTEHTLGTVVEGEETDEGLRIRADVDEDEYVQRLVGKVARGHVEGMSIGYETMAASFEEIDGDVIRHLTEVKLFEGSVTPFPANEDAVVLGVKSPAARARLVAQGKMLLEAALRAPGRKSASDDAAIVHIMQLVEELLESGDVDSKAVDEHTARAGSDGKTAPLAGSRLVIARAKLAREAALELSRPS